MYKSFLKCCVAFCVMLFSGYSLHAQKGNIEGIVRDAVTKETLVGASVVIKGTNNGSISDFDGNFMIGDVTAGIYTLQISFVSYNMLELTEVTVEANKSTRLEIDLEPSTVQLQEVVVTAVKRTNTEISMISSIKASNLVASGITSQQITRAQDRDASEVVKRVPGITISDNRFIIVRGLNQRYNDVWLNNAPVPSTEADAKSFSFDMVPSSMIDNIVVIKSSSPEIPADFAGGFVKITTNNMPQENSFSISYSSSYNSGTTFKSFYNYKGSKTDWLGYDDGMRALPSDMPSNLNIYDEASNPVVRNKVTDVGRELPNNWNMLSSKAIPDQRFGIGISRRFALGSNWLGNVTSFTYSNTYDSKKTVNNTYTIYNFRYDKPAPSDEFSDEQYTRTAKIGVLHNWALYLGNGQKIEFKNLFNQIGSSRSILRTGREWYNDGRYIKAAELGYMSRSIYSGQLAGSHSFKEGTTRIDWNASYSFSDKDEPDLKRYRRIRSQTDTTQYMLLFGENPDLSSQARYWLNLSENLYSASVDFCQKFSFGSFTPELKIGFYAEKKDREFKARNFGYAMASDSSTFSGSTLPVEEIFSSENINLTSGIKLVEMTSKSDSYKATYENYAAYLALRLPISNKINIYTGARIEKTKQTLDGYYLGSTSEAKYQRDTINIYPSLNTTYNFNEKNLIRVAYGMTVNRPEFREISPFYFVDFNLNAGIMGNTSLNQSYIHNIDLRYEYYPSQNETFSLGVFYKIFIDPIEMVIIGNTPQQFSFQNVDKAHAYGLETEVRKSLDFIGVPEVSVVANAAWIKSKISFADGSLQRDRALQGQSPYIINTSVFYQNDDKGFSANLLYNVIGPRIVAVGIPSPNEWEDVPNIVEEPRNIIDFNISKKIGKYLEIKFALRDLLNQKVTYKQTIDTDVDMSLYDSNLSETRHFTRKQVNKSYRPGSYFTLGLSARF
jgi:outer membrane receptor for ferrienterochelin and colicin